MDHDNHDPGFHHHVTFCLHLDRGEMSVKFYPETDDPAQCAQLLKWAVKLLHRNRRLINHAAGDHAESDLQ
jgi:hypothetical protein